MKVKIRFLFTILAVCVFMSACGLSTFIPEEDYQKLVQKATMKSFEQLNNPVLFSNCVYGKFHKKNNSSVIDDVRIGTVFYVYDWETNTIYDYLYMPDSEGSTNSILNQLCPDENGNCDYYYFRRGKKDYYVFNSNQQSYEKVNLGNYNLSFSFNTGIYRPAYLPFFVNNDNPGINKYKIQFYNPKTKQFKEIIDKEIYSTLKSTPIADSDGNYWFFETDENDKSLRQIVKLDVNQNIAKEIQDKEIKSTSNYIMYCADSEYLYIKETTDDEVTESVSIAIFDKSAEKIIKKIPVNLGEELWIHNMISVNDTTYIFIYEPGEEDYYQFNVKIAELDVQNETVTIKTTVPESSFKPGEFFARENKIYSLYESFYNNWSKIYCYDIVNNTAEELLTVSISSLCE